MKRLISLIIALFFALSLFSCTVGEDKKDKTDNAELKIVTTVFPQYDFARQIARGANGVSLQMLLPPGNESHDYEPSVADLAAIADADLVICVGGETDDWIDSAVTASGSSASVLRLTDTVPLYREDSDNILESGHSHEHFHDHSYEHGDGESEESEEHHDHSGYDEHVWTSPRNAAAITEAICAEMVQLAPHLAGTFRENTDDYCESLAELYQLMLDTVQSAERHTLIFADRFPFRYLAEHLGLDCYAAFSGCSSDSEPSLATVWQLTKKAKEAASPVILTVEFSKGDAARVIADETGGKVATLHSCHNVSKEDFASGATYLSLMRENLEVLTAALN